MLARFQSMKASPNTQQPRNKRSHHERVRGAFLGFSEVSKVISILSFCVVDESLVVTVFGDLGGVVSNTSF